jgi:hypothetical protein
MSKYIGATAVNLSTTSADVTGNATIGGNLTVQGTTITIDSANAQTVDLGDNDKIRLGDGDDLQIYHNGSQSYISDSGTGNLNIVSDSDLVVDVVGNIHLDAAGNNIVFKDDGSEFGKIANGGSNLEVHSSAHLSLRPNNGTSATNNSVWVQGNPKPWASDYFDLGSSTYKWQDLYLSQNAYVDGYLNTPQVYINDSIIHNGDGDTYFNFGTDAINLVTGGSTRLALDSSGNATFSGLVVADKAAAIGLEVIGDSTGYTHGAIALKSGTGSDPRVRGQGIYLFNEENDTTWYVGTPYLNTSAGSRPFDFNFASSTTSLSTQTATSPTYTAFRVHPSGVISTPTGIELGSGVDATTSNTLDDYEQGTFTPTLKKGSTTSFNYVSQIGKYTKIGNTLKISIYIFCSTPGTTNNGAAWQIAGLPFSISALSDCAYQFLPVGYLLIANVDRFTNLHRWQANSSSYLSLYGANASTESNNTNLEFSATGILTVA